VKRQPILYESISFVLPACNEALSVGRVVSSIKKLYSDAEIIVVDDGSTDQTAEAARASGAKVLTHLYRMGNGAAIKTGARAATGGTLVFLDADGQHSIESVAVLLNERSLGYDLVVGSRRDRASHSSLLRWVANSFYNFLASKVTGFPIEDLTSGLRLVDRSKFLSILHLLPNGFSYPTTSTMAFIRSAYQVKFVPVAVSPDATDGSHISLFKDGARFFLIIFKIGMLYSPFKFLVPMALFQLVTLILLYLPGLLDGAPKFSNGMAMLAVGAVLTLGIATLAEQVTTLMYKAQ